MACTSPLPARRDSDGRIKIGESFNTEFELPCGQCLSCRISKQRDWAVRCMHEAQIAGEKNSHFITLTYNDSHLPHDHGLRVRDWQLFRKRLSNWVGPVRYLACGEYGEGNLRPHYHAALFGHDFEDKVYWKKSPKGFATYRSADLEYAWRCRKCGNPKGFALLGELTFDSAAYVAGYVTKKVTGSFQNWAYTRFINGKAYRVKPEFAIMSRRPGIGAEFFSKYESDIFPHDYCVTGNGKQVATPKYYSYLLGKRDSVRLEPIKEKRRREAEKRSDTAASRRARDATLRAEKRLYTGNEYGEIGWLKFNR